MNKNGPIIIIEDDHDDQELFSNALKELDFSNEIIFFGDGDEALDFLNSTKEKPFIIISDINLPKLTGIELREKVYNNEELKMKCIPYLFFTSSRAQATIIDAYSKSIQGFFVKPSSYKELTRMLKNIILYWKDCEAPEPGNG
ncbi:MAG TPA: response regulator [Ferruginibacter sp.]|nr:response regulator [Ferruginibacter sp.]